MAEFETPAFSKRQVKDAGKVLIGEIGTSASEVAAAVQTFKIAHNWRAAHIVPMRHLRSELSAKARKVGGKKVTVARLTRMQSIRKKLRSAPYTLYQMQDIGGCRVILETKAAMDELLQIYDREAAHTFRSESDYVARPKSDGYRSVHRVYVYKGAGEFSVLNKNSISIELQFRTRLQHAWATAVEAVGMVRVEDLKGGGGDKDWLRLFALMSAEFAHEEKSPPVPGVQVTKAARQKELIRLDEKLQAIKTLESYNHAIKFTESTQKAISPIYLIQYNNLTKAVSVHPLSQATSAARYNSAEGNPSINTVLVEVEKVADLKAAYPNYFLDVQMFTERLRLAIHGKPLTIFDNGWLKRTIEKWKLT